MVSRRRFHTFLTGIGLYAGASLLIGYFAVNAYTGNRGLRAQQDLDYEYAERSKELEKLKIEEAYWRRRIDLLKADSIDPDMADERARAMLNYSDPHDLILLRPAR